MDLQKIVKNNLKEGKLVLGVSGGPDSMCLLHILYKLKKEFIIVHVNHGLRGKDSDTDEKFVRNLAKKYGLKFISKKIKVTGKGIEEKAREERYKIFHEVQKKYSAKYIVTAHNLNDNIETILLNITRGCGLRGLRGMKILQSKILRPLLTIPKNEILNYMKKNKLEYRIDRTNKDMKFSRNFVRIKILPELLKLNPNLLTTVSKNAANILEIEDFINAETEKFLRTNLKKTGVPLEKFRKQHAAIQKNIISKIFEKFNGDSKNLQKDHIGEILSVINKGIGRKQKTFQKIKIEILNKNIVFSKLK